MFAIFFVNWFSDRRTFLPASFGKRLATKEQVTEIDLPDVLQSEGPERENRL